MKLLLVGVGLAGIFSVTRGAANCADCGGTVCMLDGSSTSLTGGATSVSVNFCNFDSSQNGSYALSLGVSSLPACDTSNATLPELKSLVAADGCTADTCSVTVSFKAELDWAVALQSDGVGNSLTGQLSGSSDVVKLATFEPMAAAVMNSGSEPISVCATKFGVSGSRFSRVGSCNAAQICRGATTDATCTTQLSSNAKVDDVSCSGEACTGQLVLSESLPCDGATGDATAVAVGVTVARSSQSNFAAVGSMTTPNFTISHASGADTGSSELVLTTDSFCAFSSIRLNVTMGDDDDDVLEVSSVNSTINGTVVVQLSSPLSRDLVGEEMELSLSQCDVTTTTSLVVGQDGSDSSFSVSTGSTASSSENDLEAGTAGSVSTQEENSSTGLSNSILVAIVIACAALAGFVFECIHHKRRQPIPMAQDSTMSSLATPM